MTREATSPVFVACGPLGSRWENKRSGQAAIVTALNFRGFGNVTFETPGIKGSVTCGRKYFLEFYRRQRRRKE